jgi:hypothetical protein
MASVPQTFFNSGISGEGWQQGAIVQEIQPSAL